MSNKHLAQPNGVLYQFEKYADSIDLAPNRRFSRASFIGGETSAKAITLLSQALKPDETLHVKTVKPK